MLHIALYTALVLYIHRLTLCSYVLHVMSDSEPATSLQEKMLQERAISYLLKTPASSLRLCRKLRGEVPNILKACKTATSKDINAPENGFEIEDLIEQVCHEMANRGLIDDLAYANGVADSLKRRGKSLIGIRAGLIQREVPSQVIDSVMTSMSAFNHDRAAACIYVHRRRIGPLRPLEQRKLSHAKDVAALCRQGFAYEIASEIMELDGEDSFEEWSASWLQLD